VCFTVRDPAPAELYGVPVVGIGYGAFTDDVEVGLRARVSGCAAQCGICTARVQRLRPEGAARVTRASPARRPHAARVTRQVGDHLLVDGGMVELVVTKKAGPDVIARSLETGLILSRANVTCRCDLRLGAAVARGAAVAQKVWSAAGSPRPALCTASSVMRPAFPSRRKGELIRGRAAMLSVITGKDWRDIGGRVGGGGEGAGEGAERGRCSA
jgi:hypothetical protein